MNHGLDLLISEYFLCINPDLATTEINRKKSGSVRHFYIESSLHSIKKKKKKFYPNEKS